MKVNYDLRHTAEWLRANRISLNTGKTELVFFLHLKTKKLPKI